MTGKRPVKSQKGRSLVELLGILCIIGLLSVGGIVGYRQLQIHWSMQKFYRNAAGIALSVLTIYKPSDFRSNDQDISAAAASFGFYPDDIQFVQQRFGVILNTDDPLIGGQTIRIRISGIPEQNCGQVLFWRTKEVAYISHVESGLNTTNSSDGDISDSCEYMNTFDIAYSTDKDLLASASGGSGGSSPPPVTPPEEITPPLQLSDVTLCRLAEGTCDSWNPCKKIDTFRAYYKPKDPLRLLSIEEKQALCKKYSTEATRTYVVEAANETIALTKLDDNCEDISEPSFLVRGLFIGYDVFKGTTEFITQCGSCPEDKPNYYSGTCHVCKSTEVQHNTACCPQEKPHYYDGACQTCPENQVLTAAGTCCPEDKPNYYNAACHRCLESETTYDAAGVCCAAETPYYYGSVCHRCPEGMNEAASGLECCPASEPHFYGGRCNPCPSGQVFVGGTCCPSTSPYLADGICSECEKGKEKFAGDCVCLNHTPCQLLLSAAASDLTALVSTKNSLETAGAECGSFPFSPCSNTKCQCRLQEGRIVCSCEVLATYGAYKAQIAARTFVKTVCSSGTLKLILTKQTQIVNKSEDCSCDALSWENTSTETTSETNAGACP